MVVAPCGADRATSTASSWMENPIDKERLLLKHQWLDHRFCCEDNNVAFTYVQPHHYRVGQVEPCHQLG